MALTFAGRTGMHRVRQLAALAAAVFPGAALAAWEYNFQNWRHAGRAEHRAAARVHLLDLLRDLRRRFRRDVLFADQAPQIDRSPGGAIPREHAGRDRLDGDSVPDPAVHGVSGDADDSFRARHVGARHDDQGHRVPVEVELRLHAGRLRLLLEPRDAARADRWPRAEGPELPARSRQSARRAGRHQGARADHRERRDPFVVGPGVRHQAGRDPGLRARHVVPRREGRRLPRTVRRALRQGARVHAGRRRRQEQGRLREVGRRAEVEARPPCRRTPTSRWTCPR